MDLTFVPSTKHRLVVLDIETLSLDENDDRGALDALRGRVVSIAMLFDDGKHVSTTTLTMHDERKLLELFWSEVTPKDVFGGHCILNFDLPFILQRCWVHGIKPQRKIDLRKFYTADVIDTAEAWSFWGNKKGVSLNALGAALNCGQKSGHGSEVADWWKAGDLAHIGRYCLDDVILTYRVLCALTYRKPLLVTPPETTVFDSLINAG